MSKMIENMLTTYGNRVYYNTAMQQKRYRIKQATIQIGGVNVTVNEFMLKSGVPAALKGFELVKRAIEICMENPEISCMELYEVLGNEKGISKGAVEHRIRTAIKRGFNDMDKNLKQRLFGDKVHIRNNDYIKNVAYAIKHVI